MNQLWTAFIVMMLIKIIPSRLFLKNNPSYGPSGKSSCLPVSFNLILLILVLTCLFPSCQFISKKRANKDISLHEKIFTIDTHTDTPLRFTDDTFNMAREHNPILSRSRVDIPRMKKGGLDALFLAVFISQSERTPQGHEKAWKEALHIFDAIDQMLLQNNSLAELALTPEDALNIAKTGKRAFLTGVENGYPVGHDLNKIKYFYSRGARYITLCHTKNNDICDSSTDSAEYQGLSKFGEQVVKEMNRVGMMIDVSHISDSAFYDVLKISNAPVFASHSCARALCDQPRNLSDEMIRALAKKGGVIQICILSDYVKKMPPNPARDSARAALRKKYGPYDKLNPEIKTLYRSEWYSLEERYPVTLATVADAVDHIDHIVKIAGIDFAGIGSDFDGGGGLADCFDVSQFPNITAELIKRGYDEEAIEKIWAGNFLRVFREVQKRAE